MEFAQEIVRSVDFVANNVAACRFDPRFRPPLHRRPRHPGTAREHSEQAVSGSHSGPLQHRFTAAARERLQDHGMDPGVRLAACGASAAAGMTEAKLYRLAAPLACGCVRNRLIARHRTPNRATLTLVISSAFVLRVAGDFHHECGTAKRRARSAAENRRRGLPDRLGRSAVALHEPHGLGRAGASPAFAL